MRIAIVHDKLVQFGGAERVVRDMRRIWPDADLYTSAFDPDLVRREGLGEVRATFLQRMPGGVEQSRWLMPFYDLAFRSLDLDGYDLVLSSSAMFAKSVRSKAAPHLCYCHIPVRYLWEYRDSHIGELPHPAPVRLAASLTVPWLRRRDLRAVAGVDMFVANSHAIADQIRRHYGREAEVVPPGVDSTPFAGAHERGDYLLLVARLYPYKRVDLAIEAANRLGVPLKIVGEGSDRPRLEQLAGDTVEFLGWVVEEDKPALFGSARALLAPQIEDFGIVMVEALAAGTPVVALNRGGAVDILSDGETGVLFSRQTADELVDAIGRLERESFDREVLRARARAFSPERFQASIRELAERALAAGKTGKPVAAS